MQKIVIFLVLVGFLLILFSCTVILNTPPEKPTNPNPSNSTTDIDGYRTVLSWSCSDTDNDKLTFDVYFGTSPGNLEKIAEKIQTNTYTITTTKYEILSKGTKYYWKIIASDGKNKPVSGDVWEFTTTTGNYAPKIKRIITPKEGETGISLTPKFEWEAYDPDGDKLYFDLYIGTNELTKLATDLEVTSYELNEDKKLSSKTEYKWKVIVKDDKGGQTESEVCKFSTLNTQPAVPTPIEPKDGIPVSLTTNQINLKWECNDPDGDQLTYDIYFGTNSNPPIVKSNYTSKSYQVSKLESGKMYYWKIVAKDGKGGVTRGPVWRFNVVVPGALKWRFQTDNWIRYSPAIGQDGTIYVGSDDDYLYAITPDGKLKWKFQTGGDISSSPAIGQDGTIYVGSDDDYLYAITPNGKLKWKFQTGGDISSSPAIGSDGTIYVGSYDYYVYAINPNGTLKWGYKTGSYVYSSPAIGPDGTIYVGSYDYYVYAINPNGTLKWGYKTGSYVYSSPAIGQDGTIYVGSLDNYFYAINPNGTLKWKYKTDGVVRSSPVVGTDNTVYAGSSDGYVYAINSDGTLRWKFKTGGGVNTSPVIGADGTIYFGSYDNYVYAINPNGTLRWRYQTGLDVTSSPAIAQDGTVYVGSWDKYLYAFFSDSPGLANSPWPKFRKNNRNTGRFDDN